MQTIVLVRITRELFGGTLCRSIGPATTISVGIESYRSCSYGWFQVVMHAPFSVYYQRSLPCIGADIESSDAPRHHATGIQYISGLPKPSE